jgi:hypothetical protein
VSQEDDAQREDQGQGDLAENLSPFVYNLERFFEDAEQTKELQLILFSIHSCSFFFS